MTPTPDPAEVAELRETIKRLNRRCQKAEAAANLQADKWGQRSKGAGRAYLFDLARRSVREEVKMEIDALTQAVASAEAHAIEPLAALADHWFVQGGAEQFGALLFNGRAPSNMDEMVAAILSVVRAPAADAHAQEQARELAQRDQLARLYRLEDAIDNPDASETQRVLGLCNLLATTRRKQLEAEALVRTLQAERDELQKKLRRLDPTNGQTL